MKRTVLIALSFLATLFFSFLLVGGVLNLLPTDEWNDGLATFVSYSVSMLLAIGLLAGLKGALRLVVPSLRPEIRRIDLPLVLLGFLLIMSSNVALHPIANLFSDDWLEPITTLLNSGLWAVVNAVVMAPILEEYLMRGVVQNSLVRSSGKVWVGIVLSAVLFGAIHIIPQQVLAATAAGVVLGAIYAATHSLYTVVLVHMLVNGTAYLQFLFLGEDFDPLESLCTTNYVLAIGAAWIILIGAGVWAVRKIGKK